MTTIQCFKSIEGKAYDSEVKKYYLLLPKWNQVYEKVSELLGENITKLAHSKESLVVDLEELTKEENKKIFKLDGRLKSNSKRAKYVLKIYREIIEEAGLSGFMPIHRINFIYGVMRSSQYQSLEGFRANDIMYYRANFDVRKRSDGMLEPITEVEYQETYLAELKKAEHAEA